MEAPGDGWVADRNFSTLKFLFRIHKAKAAFAIREHAQVEGELVARGITWVVPTQARCRNRRSN